MCKETPLDSDRRGVFSKINIKTLTVTERFILFSESALKELILFVFLVRRVFTYITVSISTLLNFRTIKI